MTLVIPLTIQIRHAIGTPPRGLRSSCRKSVCVTAPNLFINKHKLLLNIFTDNRIILRTLHSVHTLTSKGKIAIAVYYAQQVSPSRKMKRLTHYLPNTVDKWGKIRIIGESECVRSVYGQISVGENRRDASFARVSLINIIQLVLILGHISSTSSWTNMRMTRDDLQGTSRPLYTDKYNITHMSRYGPIKTSD